MTCSKIYVNSDTLYQVTSLRNAITGVLLNSAVITVQLFKSGDIAQIGIDIIMTAVGSDGDYWCILPNTNSIDPNDTYYLLVEIIASTYTVTKKIFLTSEWSS
ncbi:MAG: hypothetical protein DRH97_01730 [Chloroflexi bacterium]|nr:MAG: hypothetical protein DRH97_01730 [Chloroflexota bacterium]